MRQWRAAARPAARWIWRSWGHPKAKGQKAEQNSAAAGRIKQVSQGWFHLVRFLAVPRHGMRAVTQIYPIKAVIVKLDLHLMNSMGCAY